MIRSPAVGLFLHTLRVILSCAAGVGALLLAVLSWTSYGDARMYMEQLELMRASEAWPVVEGTVLGRGVDEELPGRFSLSSRTRYHARLSYDYTVDGERHTGERICFDNANCGTGTSREDAQALLDQYPVQAVVQVRYNPDAPGQCALRIGEGDGMRKGMRDSLVTTGLSVVGVLLLATAAVRIGAGNREDADDD
jgi:hypothetical protein